MEPQPIKDLRKFISHFLEEREDSAFSPEDIQGYMARRGYVVPDLPDIRKKLKEFVDSGDVIEVLRNKFKSIKPPKFLNP